MVLGRTKMEHARRIGYLSSIGLALVCVVCDRASCVGCFSGIWPIVGCLRLSRVRYPSECPLEPSHHGVSMSGWRYWTYIRRHGYAARWHARLWHCSSDIEFDSCTVLPPRRTGNSWGKTRVRNQSRYTSAAISTSRLSLSPA